MKRIIAGALGLAVLASAAIAPVAGAQTSTVDISALVAQIAALQAQLAALQGGSASASVSFTRDLSVGARGTDVTALQNILISKGFLGAGLNTGYFGALTKAGVAAWQASVGLPSTGYFGPLSRAQVAMVVPPVVVPPGQVPPTTSLDGTDGSITASLSSYAGNTTIKKGETKDMVAVKLQATAGKVAVTRFDVRMNQRPWLYFSQIQLKDTEGTVIATKNLSGSADATEVTVGSDYLVRFEGINYVVTPGTDRTIVVTGTVLATTDKLTSDVNVIVSVPNASIRTMNGKGYTDSVGLGAVATSGTSGRTVTLSSTGSNGNVIVKASANQTARIQTTSTNGQTNNVVLGTYDFKAQNQSGTINTLTFTLREASNNRAWSSVLKNLRLTDGSNTYNVDSVATSSTFSNLNINLPLEQWKTLSLVADIADQDDFVNGMIASTTLTANTTNVVGLDANYNALSVTSATPSTPNVTFLSAGASVSNIAASVTPVNNGTSAVVKHEVTMSFTLNNTGDVDLYVSKIPGTALATSTTASSSGLTLVNASGTNSNDTADYYVVSPNSPRTFTYTGIMNNQNGTSGSKEFKITGINFDDDTTGLQEFVINYGLEALRVTATY